MRVHYHDLELLGGDLQTNVSVPPPSDGVESPLYTLLLYHSSFINIKCILTYELLPQILGAAYIVCGTVDPASDCSFHTSRSLICRAFEKGVPPKTQQYADEYE